MTFRMDGDISENSRKWLERDLEDGDRTQGRASVAVLRQGSGDSGRHDKLGKREAHWEASLSVRTACLTLSDIYNSVGYI